MEVLGLFKDLESAAAGVEALVQGGFSEDDLTSMSAGPFPEGVLVKEQTRSYFRWFSLLGGVIGAVLGFLLAAGTAMLYPLYTGEKAIISLFPVGIITYEFTMLFAILGTIGGMFLEMGLPRFRMKLYDPGISDGLIGIVVRCADGAMANRAGEILEKAGVVRIRREDES